MAVHHRNTASSHAQGPPLSIARVALYARVSTLNGQDPEMQLSELREYAARRGWTTTGEYVDQDVSGSKESRPELNQLRWQMLTGGSSMPCWCGRSIALGLR